jgi:hypothetical protein
VTKMRAKDPGEGIVSAYLVRPLVWAAFQFSTEARFIRKHRRVWKDTPPR